MTTAPTAPARRPIVVAVLIGVLLAVAVLAYLFWPNASTGPVVRNFSTGHYQLRLSTDRPHVGSNTITLDVADTQGRPVQPDSVTIEPVMPLMGHALTPVTARSRGAAGHFVADDTTLTMSGQWELTVDVSGPLGREHAVFPLLVTN